MKALDRRSLSIAGAIGLAHVVVVGVLVSSQGCRTPTPGPTSVEPPPAPVMPPPAVPETIQVPPVTLPPPTVEAPAPAPQRPALLPPREYTVQPGDSLSKIAARYGVSTRELTELNNLKDPNKIRAGQKLILPSYAADTPKPATAARPKKAEVTAGAGEYVVQKGDTLSGIAQKLGTTTRALIEANHLENADRIRAGQKLVIPAGATKKEAAQPPKAEVSAPPVVPTPAPPPAPPAATPETPPAPVPPAAPAVQPGAPAPTPSLGAGQTIRYPVGPGETLDSIAKTFLVTPEAILKANNLPDASAIKPGMTIQIPLGP